MVPCLPSFLERLPGTRAYGANSTDGGPRRTGSFEVFRASWNDVALTFSDKEPIISSDSTCTYARAGRDGLAGLIT